MGISRRNALVLVFLILIVAVPSGRAGPEPVRARTGLVISASAIASEVGAHVLKDGGTAIDAAVATAFALAVTHPVAGNIGGGGFLLYRPAGGETVAYDFREKAPARSSPTMFLKNGQYDPETQTIGSIDRHRGRRSPADPCHTTVRTGPYTAIRAVTLTLLD